ncbi:type IV secretion system protein [Caulobacter sp. UNC279MFTsu5.1]|uniref:type IV secretion system protein n=1 Tax=Caulobacter sp. UNC279MFTsu5.1 TaxID=1502775 RepID=UPI0003823942|nr:type IV secretion system protein [Caulobacter sp. UNC279MFTsu5.1]SFK57912.1 TrbL/VirB6 plasmid conjugal transfer protein [Caulobacter sp. UNC279MFTsu5.1]
MSGACPVVADSAGVVERLAVYVECQSRQIDLAAFQGGLWHGLPTALVSALMVLTVVGVGYRLILHRHLDMADLIYAVLRLGFVIAVATTFSAYSALVYTVATQGPTELAAMALAPTGLRASSLTQASHAAAETLTSLAGRTPVHPPPAPAPPTAGGDPSAKPSTPTPAPSPVGPSVDLGGAVFMLSCVGFSLAARLTLAIVLAVGPLFIAAASFDLSAGLFVGWLRALVALFLAQTGYAVSTALELSFFAQDLERLSPAPADAGDPLLVGLFFMAAGLAITLISVLAAGGLLRFALARRVSAPVTAPSVTEPSPAARSSWSAPEVRFASSASRAQRVIDAVGASAVVSEQRQNGGREVVGVSSAGAASGTTTGSSDAASPGLRRPGHLRASTGAARRDLIS